MVRRLGQGGMAEVFEAELIGAHGFARRVAIKRISAQIASDPSAAARFLEEARIASSLHHAGIVGVIDYGIMEGAPFQVLELVDGLNADQLIDRVVERGARRGGAAAGLPPDVALIIAADLAHALHHAHEADDSDGLALGIVHRDVKPSNVLISWSGDIKLTDFGIAFARGRAIQTETGLAPGSWAFMAPEQRSRSAVDRRADVFALGCTLYALLTGESPQRDLEAAIALSTGEPLALAPPPGVVLDDDVGAILARALRPRAVERYATAAAMADELGAALARRLARDPRGRMQELLAGVRAATPPRAGLLDQLLAVELVLTSEHDSLRQFELRDAPGPESTPSANAATQLQPQRRTEPAAEPPPPPAPPPAPSAAVGLVLGDLAGPASDGPLVDVPLEAPRGAAPSVVRRRLALAAGVAAALTLLWWPQPRTAVVDQLAAAPPPAAAPTVRPPDSSPAAPPPGSEPSPTAPTAAPSSEAAPPTPTPAPPPPTRRDRDRDRSAAGSPRAIGPAGSAVGSPTAPRPAATAPPSPAAGSAFATPAPAAAVESTAGYLKVVPRDRRDPRLVNARVYVDGKLRGYSPDPIAASVGVHEIRVVLEDDVTEIGTYSLEVKADHRDRGHPATLLVP